MKTLSIVILVLVLVSCNEINKSSKQGSSSTEADYDFIYKVDGNTTASYEGSSKECSFENDALMIESGDGLLNFSINAYSAPGSYQYVANGESNPLYLSWNRYTTNSNTGLCKVIITSDTKNIISGNLDCQNLESVDQAGKFINLSGTFSCMLPRYPLQYKVSGETASTHTGGITTCNYSNNVFMIVGSDNKLAFSVGPYSGPSLYRYAANAADNTLYLSWNGYTTNENIGSCFLNIAAFSQNVISGDFSCTHVESVEEPGKFINLSGDFQCTTMTQPEASSF